jgi:hypothetical protein
MVCVETILLKATNTSCPNHELPFFIIWWYQGLTQGLALARQALKLELHNQPFFALVSLG